MSAISIIFLLAITLIFQNTAVSVINGVLCLGVYTVDQVYNKNKVDLDPVIALAFFVLVSIFFYSIMFNLIEVKEYLEKSRNEVRYVVTQGVAVIQFLLLGSIMYRPDKGREVKNGIVSFPILVLAWLPIASAVIAYYGYFQGVDYVELHSSDSSLGHILIKSLYITYAYIVFSGYVAADSVKVKFHCLVLSIAVTIVFGLLFKLRSPILFVWLLYFFIFARNISLKMILVFLVLTPIILSAIALWRDPSLLSDGVLLGMLNMLVTFGDFTDAINFALDHVSTYGVSYGGNVLGAFFGYSEAIANLYARSISEEYFYSGGGFGFFFPAELIINFGRYGAFFVAFIIGFGIRVVMNFKGIHAHTFIASFFALSFAITRNDFGSTMRAVVYIWLSVCLIKGIDYAVKFYMKLHILDSVKKNNKLDQVES